MEIEVHPVTEGYVVLTTKDAVQGPLDWYVPAADADEAVLAVAHYLQAGLHQGMEARCPACRQRDEGLKHYDALVTERRERIEARRRRKTRPRSEGETGEDAAELYQETGL